MSMGPFAWVSDEGQPDLDQALRGNHVALATFDAKGPGTAIIEAASRLKVKELELASFGGEALYIAMQAPRESLLVPIRGDAHTAIETRQIVDAVKRAVAPAEIAMTRLVNTYELYYVDRQNRKPLPALYVELNDAARSAYYIDPASGRVVESYGKRSRWKPLALSRSAFYGFAGALCASSRLGYRCSLTDAGRNGALRYISPGRLETSAQQTVTEGIAQDGRGS
jgi:hypothetical protein